MTGANQADGENGLSTDHNSRFSRRQYLAAAGSATALSSGLSGCLNVLGGGSSDSLKVGYVVPTSGTYAEAGQEFIDGVNLAKSRMEDTVDGREVEILARDSGADPGKAVPATNDLINNEDIDILSGAFSSSVVLALMEIAAREEMMFFPTGGSAMRVTGSDCNKYTFASFVSSHQSASASLIAYEQDVFDSIYMLNANYPAGIQGGDAAQGLLEEAGATVAGRNPFPLGNDDFSPQISEVRDSGADAVLVNSGGSDMVRFVQQATAAGLKDEMEIILVFAGLPWAETVSDEEREGVYVGNNFYWQMDSASDFVEEFRDTYDYKPDSYGAGAFDSGMSAFDAIEQTGSTAPDDVIPHLEGREYDFTRSVKWRACDHRLIQDYTLLEGRGDSSGESLFDIKSSLGGEDIMRSCSETGCSM